MYYNLISTMNRSGIRPFIMTIDTTKAGTTASNQFNIPTTGSVYDVNIDWGDGTGLVNYSGTAPTITYTYAGSGIYTVKVYPKTFNSFPKILYGNGGDRLKVLSIEQWGSNKWTNFQSSFYGCANLVINATDTPDMSLVTSMGQAFQNCTSLTNINFTNCNFSSCTTWSSGSSAGAFFGCTNLISVNFTGVTMRTAGTYSMQSLFQNCTSLTTLTGWNSLNLSKCNIFQSAFLSCSALPSMNLSNMNLSGCTNFQGMFQGCVSLSSLNMTNITFNASSFSLQNFVNSTTSLSSITGFNTLNLSKCNSLSGFNSSGRLTSIDLSNKDLSSCTTMTAFAYNNTALTSVNLSNTNFSACTTFGATATANGAFSLCSSLTSVNMTGMVLNTTSSFTAYAMFFLSSGTLATTFTGLSSCNWGKCTAMNGFASSRVIDTTEYSNWLIELANDNTNTSISLNAGVNTKYNSSAVTARNTLTATRTWTIVDGGLV